MKSATKRVLLHACCAPCALIPLESLMEEGWQLSLYFYNPNIHPLAEYELRAATLKTLAASLEVPLNVGSWDAELWEEAVGVFGGPYPLIPGSEHYEAMRNAKEKRCAACYRLRFDRLSSFGAEQGMEYLDTTLTISPYQFTRQALKALNASAAAHNLTPLATDWRGFYPQANQRLKTMEIYRQNFCGCRFSKEEATLERSAMKEARRKSREST